MTTSEEIKLPERGPICIPSENVYDSSSLSDFMRCPFYYYNRYELKRFPSYGLGVELEFGSAIHEALAHWLTHDHDIDGAVKIFLSYPGILSIEDGKRNPEQGEALLRQYHTRWGGDTMLEILKDDVGDLFIERPFIIPVPFGEAFFAGRIDAGVRMGNEIYALDHKTTSGKHFLLPNLRPYLQFDGYSYAMREEFGSCAGLIVDFLELGKAKYDFGRVPTPRSEWELEQFPVQFLNLVAHIQLCRESSQWPKYTTHCYEYFRRCPYENLCMHNTDMGLVVQES